MIAIRLKEILAERQESLASLARATGLSYSTLHRLYSGKAKRIDLATLGALCGHLRAQPSEIIHWQDGIDDLADASLEEKTRRWPEIVERMRSHLERMKAEFGVQPDSTELIREEREKRDRQLAGL